MGKAVGIDLGTTNSVVAAIDAGQPWVIPDEEGELMLPSCVGLGTRAPPICRSAGAYR
jgi:molecular chaperone DnaK